MNYTNNTTLPTREANTATKNDIKQPNTAMPFVFGLRRRAATYIEQCRLRDDIDPAVANNATD